MYLEVHAFTVLKISNSDCEIAEVFDNAVIHKWWKKMMVYSKTDSLCSSLEKEPIEDCRLKL